MVRVLVELMVQPSPLLQVTAAPELLPITLYTKSGKKGQEQLFHASSGEVVVVVGVQDWAKQLATHSTQINVMYIRQVWNSRSSLVIRTKFEVDGSTKTSLQTPGS